MTDINELEALPPLDIQHGIKSLARFIRKTDRQTHYLVTIGAIPARQIGGRWSWSPSQVREALFGEARQ